ncbi:ATP-dependent DNA helicase [Sandaracinus amylolyticus]|uniref:ATP-dependent DNA helicase n=2 Tax=Sandaracinus amylolyticus TaxID=927083 RepID=A0A0F6YLF7_9BACT|nr:ATP-dependent DNA helicase [Sandaracinus amylolyticus]
MIGLPLRLLAREVYDRVSRAVGESQVALVTGEEKRVPRAPRYWVCTVEAMPLDVPVHFLAIDEIQLAAHRERGHVFTDRLLHARGTRETWLLGADTMAPILRELLPGARLERQARLSSLRHAGRSGLGGLPPRSAIVAFSAAEVYELAARMRQKKGGVAVVLGALSPRTRNAQVALYEAREVQYLVATDAIGMGLNLDVDHVAFAAVEKFDGREHRPLEPAELGQIAGRAGRYQRDGTFGTLNPLPGLSEKLVARLEEHRFPPVTRLVWRSPELDFASIDALLGSLSAPAPHPVFSRVEQADDFDVLRTLSERPRVRERATHEDAVRLLWDVCQIPDYRKLTILDHASLLEELFVTLVDRGHLDPGWVLRHVERIDRVEGEIDELTARLAAIRVWTYVSHQRAWIDGSLEERAREVEDRLGDALHERLVERFVARAPRATSIPRAEEAARKGGFFAQIGDMLDDVRRAEERAREQWVQRIVDAPHDAFGIDDAGVVSFGDDELGNLVAGRDLLSPRVVVAVDDTIGAGARSRIERRMAAYARDLVAELLRPIASHDAEGLVRGVLWQLERGLGTLDVERAKGEIAALSDEDRSALAERGVVIGRRTVFARGLLSAEALRVRALLVRVHRGGKEPRAPMRGAVSIPRRKEVPFESYLAVGLLPLGPRVVRVDIVERVLTRLRESEPDVRNEIGSWLGVRDRELPKVLAALGARAG